MPPFRPLLDLPVPWPVVLPLQHSGRPALRPRIRNVHTGPQLELCASLGKVSPRRWLEAGLEGRLALIPTHLVSGKNSFIVALYSEQLVSHYFHIVLS